MQRFRRNFLSLIALTVVLAMAFGATTQAGSDDVTAAVKALNAKWDNALNSGDAATVASLYAEDGRVVTGNGKILNGRGEIQDLFQGFIDGGFHEHKIELIDVKVSGNIAFETANWSGVGGDQKTYGGRLVNIYERQPGGEWQGVLHIWN